MGFDLLLGIKIFYSVNVRRLKKKIEDESCEFSAGGETDWLPSVPLVGKMDKPQDQKHK